MAELHLIRHGRSVWNAANRFTGWVDVPLSLEGIEEAHSVGRTMSDAALDEVYCSSLVRAQMTAMIALTHHESGRVPILVDDQRRPPWSGEASEMIEEGWNRVGPESDTTDFIQIQVDSRLNERHYGDLAGLDKAETARIHGEEQVHLWRRGLNVRPPNGESLQMTITRVQPFVQEVLSPALDAGRNVAIFAHGNSLRGIVKMIESVGDESISMVEIPTGVPWKYTWVSSTSDPMATRISD